MKAVLQLSIDMQALLHHYVMPSLQLLLHKLIMQQQQHHLLVKQWLQGFHDHDGVLMHQSLHVPTEQAHNPSRFTNLKGHIMAYHHHQCH